jgi:iron complex transport system ATP-binding protein
MTSGPIFPGSAKNSHRVSFSMPILELINATIVRGGRPVIQGLSLTVQPGDHTVILGPNGSGKSTLIRVLTLEDRPRAADDGAPVLTFFGRAHWDIEELRARIALVSGDLDAGFGLGTSGGRVTGADVAVSGLLGSHGVFSHHAVTAAMRDRARAALLRLGAAHLADKPLNEMSAGERRRVLIARALVATPEALLLDEPTSGLDLVARHHFMESVRELAQAGTTIILVTHHVDEIIPETRRVILLQAGRIVCDGAPKDVLTPDNLSRVFGAPMDVDFDAGYYAVRLKRAHASMID